MAANLVIFWTVPVELAHLRPRYILPLMMAFAVHLGVVVAWVWARSRIWATLGMASILALNVFGTVPRLLAGRGISDYYDRLIRSLDEKGIRTGYADFSVAAPVTMFTGERIVLSPRLGPTPNFESRIHARIVDRAGPDSLILRGRESPESLARRLRALGVTYRLDTELVPVFYDFSRRLRFQEVAGFRQGAEPNRKRRRAGRRRRPAE
ncbi:MAG: hypothetical protein ACYS1C_09370 [Planctomycetota bacterium]|jgi:hypothetical protein